MAEQTDLDRDWLAEFAQSTDRQDPPTFVGRTLTLQAIQNDLQSRIQDWRAGQSDAWAGGTWLVQGAPGAGKSALLRELAKCLPGQVTDPAHPESTRDGVRICTVHVDQLQERELFREKLVDALCPGAGAQLAARRCYYEERLSHICLQNRKQLAVCGLLAVAAGQRSQAPWTVAALGAGLQQFSDRVGNTHPELLLPKAPPPQAGGYIVPDGEYFVEYGMIRAGLLHRNEDEELSVPIPSLVTYLCKSPRYANTLAVIRDYNQAPLPTNAVNPWAQLAAVLPAPSPEGEEYDTVPSCQALLSTYETK